MNFRSIEFIIIGNGIPNLGPSSPPQKVKKHPRKRVTQYCYRLLANKYTKSDTPPQVPLTFFEGAHGHNL